MPLSVVRKQKINKKEALERVNSLLKDAQAAKSQELADKYVKLARRLQMRHKLRMPREFKYKFCKKCGAYWRPGKTVRIRTHNGKVVYACLKCKAMRRIPFGK